MNIPWWAYVILAGLSWGTYVPIIAYGGLEFGGKPNARLAAILCVGLAYFVLAVVFPMILFSTGQQESPGIKTNAVVFSCLAGVAGAVGAMCVVFATSTSMAAAKEAGLPPTAFKLYIAPIIFGLAPVINTIISLFWHPSPKDGWNNFHFETPSPLLLVGIVLVGAGAALVLYSKEVSEAPKPPPAVVEAPVTGT
jgi:uncharacterized membrane protein